MRSDVGRAALALALGLVPLSLAAGTPQADLRVAITDGRTRALPGETLTYDIEVYNAGPDPASLSSVTTELVPSFVPAGWTCTGFSGAVCAAPSGSGGIGTTVDLPVGGLAIFTLTGTVAPGATGLLPTRATSFPPVGIDDPQPANNSQADTDNLTLDVPELVHGFDETRALTAQQDFFWITQQPFASYEVVVDATSGDIGDRARSLARADGVGRLDRRSSRRSRSAPGPPAACAGGTRPGRDRRRPVRARPQHVLHDRLRPRRRLPHPRVRDDLHHPALQQQRRARSRCCSCRTRRPGP